MCADYKFQEKRRCGRWKIGGLVFIKKGDEEIRGFCEDVSFKGIRIIVFRDLDLSEIFELTLTFPERRPIKTICKVIWKKEISNNKLRAGLSFLKISDADKEEIFDYVLKTDPLQLSNSWWR